MTSKERFQVTCAHRMPDRFPTDGHVDGSATDSWIWRYYQAENETELLDRLGCDFHYLSCRDISQNESVLPIYRGPKLQFTESARTCPFGIRWSRGAYRSKFFVDEVRWSPLENAASPKDILQYPWPKIEWFDFEPLLAECEAHAQKVIVGGFWSGIFGDSYRMLGFEKFLLSMAMNPELIKTLVDRMTDFYLSLNECLFAKLKGKIDLFFFGNDYGTQAGLIFSRKMWEEFFYENTKRLTELAHGYGLKVMMHSCGAISELIPLFIETGVDILDPIQTSARGMDPVHLKTLYGDRIVFHGGVDAQQILRNGSPEEVYQYAVEIMRILGRNGGYIFAPTQGLQPDIPVENIEAMYKAVRDFKVGAE